MNTSLARFLPILSWGRTYDRASFSNDACFTHLLSKQYLADRIIDFVRASMI